jgi:hypothetical protein
LLNLLPPYCYVQNSALSCPEKESPERGVHMKNYGFKPFETVIALITTQYISDHVSRTELGRIINPRDRNKGLDADQYRDRLSGVGRASERSTRLV